MERHLLKSVFIISLSIWATQFPEINPAQARKVVTEEDKGSVEDLIRQLGDRNPLNRMKAADALGREPASQALPALIRALKDENSIVREIAAGSLIKVGRPAIAPLIQALNENEWILRSEAAKILGGLEAHEAIPSLIALLKDEVEAVRRSAAMALGDALAMAAMSATRPNPGMA